MCHGATRVPPQWYESAAKVPYECCESATRVPPGCYHKSATRVPPQCHVSGTTAVSCECHKIAAKVPRGSYFRIGHWHIQISRRSPKVVYYHVLHNCQV